ncbi:MAG: hypothetical protein JNM99_16920 [Verrucomicrobiaceae bacterium]|nr:hypothetical protein [Verrucomicrobiaceae bacterium]
MQRFAAPLFLLLVSVVSAQQPLQFLARPFDVEHGDSVVFSYLVDESTVPLSSIKSWKWDFDGDGLWDEQKSVGGAVTSEQINTTWQAVYNTNMGTAYSTTARSYTPRLQITKTDNSIIQNGTHGITEDMFGLDGVADPAFIVRQKDTSDPNINVSFYGNPRLARTTAPRTDAIKFFAEVSFKAGVTGSVTSYAWDLDGNGADDVVGSGRDSVTAKFTGDSGADFYYPTAAQKYNVSLKVQYQVNGGSATWSPAVTQVDFLVILTTPAKLSMGRAYRQGFPERYGWNDVIRSYSSKDASGLNSHVYFGHLEDAFYEQYNALIPITARDPYQGGYALAMAESVNELLQGQSLRGYQGMIDALRLRYPRLVDPATVPDRLPTPIGAREETAALETAALDFSQSTQYAAYAVRAYGPAILRPTPDPSKIAPYPQFPQYVTFQDSTLSGAPIPVKNEYWQLSGAADGQAQARVEKAKVLWRHSLQDETALPEAKEEAKVAATQSYLMMALMANGQTENQFAQNEGGSLMAHVKIATDLFDKINAGVNPLGNDGSFIPNESFVAIHQDAQEAVSDAREAEVDARNEKRTFDRNQADLRNELLSQRNSYITPLKLLTGIDPASYNNLQTVTDQKDFRNTFYSRLNYLNSNYPNADPTILGEYGAQVAAIFDAGLNLQDQVTTLNNLYEGIKISQWANAEVEVINLEATAKLKAHDIARGYANGITLQTGVGGFPPAPFWSLNVNTGPIISGYLNASDRDIQTLQQARIADVQLELEIRKILLQQANISIAIRRAKAQLDQAYLRLDSMKAQMERYIEDLAHTRDTAADLYFMDPSFRISASLAEKRAQAELEYAIDKLYRLAKTLEYEWTEPYRNPLLIPANSQEPPALTNTLFDKFTKLDSLFIVRSADEAKDYLDALKEWDSKLRRVNVTSVRGPNRSAPISAVPISLREHVLGLKPNTATGYTLEKSIADFRNYLENNRIANFYNSANPTLEIRFPLGIEDNTYFPATGSRWNMRLATIAADLYAESGFSDQQVAEIDFIQSGMVTLRRYWAAPPAADDLMKLSFNVDNLDRTVFATAFPARINGATGGRPLTEFDNAGLADRPVGTTEWILRINTENPANRNIDFTKLKDIVLRFTYTYGNAPEFPNF